MSLFHVVASISSAKLYMYMYVHMYEVLFMTVVPKVTKAILISIIRETMKNWYSGEPAENRRG